MSEHDWQPGDHADVCGMPVELLRRSNVGCGLWVCARIFPKDDSPRTVLCSEDLMVPFIAAPGGDDERLREHQDDNTDLLENLRKGQTTGQGSPKQQPPDRSRTQFAVFYDTRAELTTPWVVIYRTTNPNSSLNEGVWGRYQSNIVNEATAKEIADALQAAGVDPERA